MGKILRQKLPYVAGVAVAVFLAFGLAIWVSSPAKKAVPDGLQNATSTWTVIAGVPEQTGLNEYIQVVDSCGPYFTGVCVNMRSGPGVEYPVVMKLRNNMVLKVADTVEEGGRTWYKIGFDGEIHYPERVIGDWYVVADYVRLFRDAGEIRTTRGMNATSTKRIVIDLTKEILYAYDGDTLFIQKPISSGLELTPTPLGKFWVYRKTPDSYMQGPIPGLSDQYYDLPGVPWNLYFTRDGGAIHGAYWHDHFGQPWSHGCVNLPPVQAEILYEWADLGTPVTVHN